MLDTKNTDPSALITLGDLSDHFSQGAAGHIMLSEAAKQFIADGAASAMSPEAVADLMARMSTHPDAITITDAFGVTIFRGLPA